jgi:hypothetical protein
MDYTIYRAVHDDVYRLAVGEYQRSAARRDHSTSRHRCIWNNCSRPSALTITRRAQNLTERVDCVTYVREQKTTATTTVNPSATRGHGSQ